MSGAGHIDTSNKKVALMIAVLAAVLAMSETLGKGAQTTALTVNTEASNLWSFFQAKTIRMTTVRTAAESADVDLLRMPPSAAREALEKQVLDWKKSAARYDSEPETNEGRKELAVRAKAAESKRDQALAAFHQYETASGALQLAIVLASATIVTGAMWLFWVAGGLGLIGALFCALGFFAPYALHLW